jgi:hypothetical protein
METLMIILLSALSLVTLVTALILIRGLFPIRVEKVQQTLENSWKRSFWIGLANTVLISVFVFGLASLGNNAPIFYIPAFGIYGAFLIGLLFGLTSFIQILGERLFPDFSPIKRDIRSGAVFLLACMLPVVGWFLLFPYIISLVIGAIVITLFQREKPGQEKE